MVPSNWLKAGAYATSLENSMKEGKLQFSVGIHTYVLGSAQRPPRCYFHFSNLRELVDP